MSDVTGSLSIYGLTDEELERIKGMGAVVTKDVMVRYTSFQVLVEHWQAVLRALPPRNVHWGEVQEPQVSSTIREQFAHHQRSGLILGFDKDLLDQICQEVGVDQVEEIAPGQFVIGGSWQALEEALSLCQGRAAKVIQLHSQLSGKGVA